MSDREAIDVLFNELKCIDRNDGIHCDRKCESCNLVMDVEIIREAYNMAISALEKQIPMKALAPELGISPRYPIIIPCGNCGMELADRMQEYCPWCGQAIDWEGE